MFNKTDNVRMTITLRSFRANIVVVEVLHIVSVCLWPEASNMQSACAMLSSVTCPALQQYFSTFYHKGHDFREKKTLLSIKCVF
jgi:hypothetical protein